MMTEGLARPAVEVDRRPDGTILLRSPEPLGKCDRAVGEWLEHWARTAPERPFLQERVDGVWRGVTYAEARERVHRLASWLLQNAPSAGPVAILSDNSVEQGLLTLAGMHVGIPVAPVSPAYSTQSRDFAKLKAIIALIEPSVVYVADPARYGPALEAIRPSHHGIEASPRTFEHLPAADEAAVDARFKAIGPDTIAKLLFTSGSTGEPKGVINTQFMLCSNQQARIQLWPFLREEPPVIVDWLPWSHTFGGNHNFNLVLRNGGTLYIDAGRPVPPLFQHTVANLRDVASTLHFNVPRGYDMLVAALDADAQLRETFFRRIRIVFFAAAALPPHLWDALRRLVRATGREIITTSAWGSTETAPLATDCHWQADRSGVIGNPAPGTELKLVPSGGKLEVRVRGPNVTPGYWKRPDLVASHWDEEGFYRIGDAVRFTDSDAPERGLMFDGRVAEDFKLDTGTWVSVGVLRVKAIAALAPVAQDIVLAGHDRSEVGFLVFPNVAACRALVPSLPADAPLHQVLGSEPVRARVQEGLAGLRNESSGSSGHGSRALLLAEPPSIDRGEITDKGYLNQRAVLSCREGLVEELYSDSAAVIVIPSLAQRGEGSRFGGRDVKSVG